MRWRPGLLLAAGFLAATALAADVLTDAARAELARERRSLAFDTARLTEITRRLETALSELAKASRSVSDAAARSDAAADDVIRREDAVSSAEGEVRVLLEWRRLLADRVVERRRAVAALEAETRAKKPSDLVSGRWAVVLDPGGQRGVFKLSLRGTIVSGEYTLEGGYGGSLRGTLINDRLRLERVDSKLGFSTVFYGRLSREGSEISGTWESTIFGGGQPGSGIWRARREEEKEESP